MSKSCETMRVPGLSVFHSVGRSLRFKDGKQIQRDDGCLADVGREEILIEHLHAIADRVLLHVLVGFGNAFGIDVDAHRLRAELRRRYRNAPVAAAKVVQRDRRP